MRVQLEKRGVLGAGHVKKRGSLPRHIPILNIYVSTPPPPPPGILRNVFSAFPNIAGVILKVTIYIKNIILIHLIILLSLSYFIVFCVFARTDQETTGLHVWPSLVQ